MPSSRRLWTAVMMEHAFGWPPGTARTVPLKMWSYYSRMAYMHCMHEGIDVKKLLSEGASHDDTKGFVRAFKDLKKKTGRKKFKASDVMWEQKGLNVRPPGRKGRKKKKGKVK